MVGVAQKMIGYLALDGTRTDDRDGDVVQHQLRPQGVEVAMLQGDAKAGNEFRKVGETIKGPARTSKPNTRRRWERE